MPPLPLQNCTGTIHALADNLNLDLSGNNKPQRANAQPAPAKTSTPFLTINANLCGASIATITDIITDHNESTAWDTICFQELSRREPPHSHRH